MSIFFEFLFFPFVVVLGICILYWCCVRNTSTYARRRPTLLSLTRRSVFRRKPDDSTDHYATSVFNISGRCGNSATVASGSTSSLEHTHMVEISIEDLPPPYDDAIVKKPESNTTNSTRPSEALK